MSDLKFEINIDEVASQFGEIRNKVAKDLKDGVKSLATMTHAKTLELATTELNSVSKIYKDALSFQEIEEGVWVVSLDEKALWIEEGRKTGFMDELLNTKSPNAKGEIKTSKEGNKYRVIPFEHSKKPSEQTKKAKELTDQIRKVLKEKGIPYKKLELGQDGSPKLGLLHRFDISSARIKETHKDEPLKGIAIYQKKDEATGKVSRDVMTFRVISEKSEKEGKWIYPENAKYAQGAKLMDKAFAWALVEWERSILPDIVSKYG